MKTSEMRLYLENTLSQQLIFFYIGGLTLFTIFYINSMNVNVRLGIFIMVNIVLSLVGFLMAVRQKSYSSFWGYVGIALALFQFARLLWMPEEIVGSVKFISAALLIATGISALVGSIICIKLSHERQKFIVEHNIDLSLLQR
ncbi:MAG: hypothetical protein D6768_10180 [Chloroflexi bacterium]|nr:MAG: hypothetical protein D6768_10180 [Chloroflexota bacterium]